MNLEDVGIGVAVTVARVGGERAFRRRLMELGILPGTEIVVMRIAPLGDPMELRVRGCLLSIRRAEARAVAVSLSKTKERVADLAGAPAQIPPGLPASP